ncbi:MAG TPA: FAD-dependent oxidoreductase [Steroidobacteraceae bacterium]|nr:FAD-dependent oxidoreductase [Steroidobacteraceae bacterium]
MRLSRRRFLKSAALGGGGVLAGSAALNAVSPLIWHEPAPLDVNTSFWARSQAPLNPPLSHDLTVDVAVVGGGLTGLSSAYYIRRASPEKSVAVLEARGCGNGASGRNGAMVLTMTADRFMSFSAHPAVDKSIYDLTAGNIRAMAALGAAMGLDCELDTPGTLQVFDSVADASAAAAYVRQARSLGMPVECWDAARLAAAIGTEAYLGGFYDPNGGHVHPMKLVRVFKLAAESAGASIYESTPVEHIEEGQVNALGTGNGHFVLAKSLVLASNAFTPSLGFLRNSILPIREYVGITRPLSAEEIGAIGWRSRAPFNDSKTELYYFGLTREGRIHIGGGPPEYRFDNGPADPRDLDSKRRRLRAELLRVFPKLAGVELELTWNGVIDWSLDAAPAVGRTGRFRNVFYAIGFSGHGVNLSSVFGRIIADLEAGREQAWSRYPFVNAHLGYVPNEPFRWIGAEAGLAWYGLTRR